MNFCVISNSIIKTSQTIKTIKHLCDYYNLTCQIVASPSDSDIVIEWIEEEESEYQLEEYAKEYANSIIINNKSCLDFGIFIIMMNIINKYLRQPLRNRRDVCYSEPNLPYKIVSYFSSDISRLFTSNFHTFGMDERADGLNFFVVSDDCNLLNRAQNLLNMLDDKISSVVNINDSDCTILLSDMNRMKMIKEGIKKEGNYIILNYDSNIHNQDDILNNLHLIICSLLVGIQPLTSIKYQTDLSF